MNSKFKVLFTPICENSNFFNGITPLNEIIDFDKKHIRCSTEFTREKMKCFYYFKEKARTRGHKSAPELRNPGSKSDNSGTDSGGGVMKSTGSEIFRRGISDLYEEKSPNLRVFSWSELRIATNDFNRKLKIGEGGFGCVYQGKIKPVDGKGDPILVAVKKLNKDGFQVYLIKFCDFNKYRSGPKFRTVLVYVCELLCFYELVLCLCIIVFL